MSDETTAEATEAEATSTEADTGVTAEATTTTETTTEATTEAVEETSSATPDIGAVLGSEDWIKHVPSEFVPTASKYKTFNDYMKAHGELQSKMGQALFVPGKDATDEDRAKFYERLGRPKEATGYKLPDTGDIKLQAPDSYFQALHTAGVTQPQFEVLAKWVAENTAQQREAAQTAHAEAHRGLMKEFGSDHPAKYEMARRVGTLLLNETERKAFGIESDDPKEWPAMLVGALARVAPSFQESPHIGRHERDVGKTDDDLRAEQQELLNKPDYWTNKAHQKRADEIAEALHGNRKIGTAA